MRWGMLLVVATAGCGRFGFDPVAATDDGAGGNGLGSDGPFGDGPPAVSCMGVPATCGPTGTTSCCDSPVVSGGIFNRGYDMATDGSYTDLTRPATLSTFRLDRYEVTVGRFRQFVNAGLGTQANAPTAGSGGRTLNGMPNQGGWDPGWNGSLAADATAFRAAIKCSATYQTWTDAAGSNENRPIVCITWYEAMAFCAWDGGFLPTEAEWHYAASGGSLQRAYPWSSPAGSTTLDCSQANFGGTSWPTTACVAAGANNVGATSPAGDGVWAQSDLGGNAWEWVLDWYATPYSSPCNDCANLFTATYRVLRGGSFNIDASDQRAGYRDFDPPAFRYFDVGVRCARTPTM